MAEEKNKNSKPKQEIKTQSPQPKRNDYPSGHISSLKFRGEIQIRNK